MSPNFQTSTHILTLQADRSDQSPERFHSLSKWLKDHVVLASLIILVCSILPRLFLTMMAEPKNLLKPDSYTYITPALNLVEHGAFLDSHKKPEVTRTPGYPVFLATIMAVFGKDILGQDLRKVLVTQTMILSCSVVFLYLLARRILPPVMAFTGALVAAMSPWGAVLAGLALTDGLFIFVLSLIFLLMKLVEETDKTNRAAWCSAAVGLLTGAAVLVRPVWFFVFFVAGALLLQYGLRRKGALIVLVVMVVSAATPLFLWNARNAHQANFHGLSDISGKTIWRGLASRVKAEVTGQDRFVLEGLALREDETWDMSVEQADQERWRRAKAIFREHPVLTVYSFARSATEHIVHPSPDILTSAGLNFHGDYWVLATLWGGIVLLAFYGLRITLGMESKNDQIDRGWLLTITAICLVLTLASGMAFGIGSRYRAPLELVVPLFAGIGLVRACQYRARPARFRCHRSHTIS